MFCNKKRQKHFQKYNGGIACHDCFRKHIELRTEAKKIRDTKISKGLTKLWRTKQNDKEKECPAQTSVNSLELPLVKQITQDILQKENGVRIAAFG